MDSDPSPFYRANETLAHAWSRLAASGALDPVLDLLRQSGQELWVSSVDRPRNLEEVLGVLGPDGFDHESVLTLRSSFTVEDPPGTVREVYMPDHVCPRCHHDLDNVLESCARRCVACGFRW